MRIILDMDEVLVDFLGGAFAIHGWAKGDLERVWPPGVWSCEGAMGLSVTEFWAPIHEVGEQFWLDLKPLPWMDKVVALVEELSQGNWIIATVPSCCPSSYSGKAKWLKRHFGTSFDKFAVTAHKHMFGSPGSVLIDDREETIKKFRLAGGYGVLFPRRNNSMHGFRGDVIEYLRREIRR